MSNDKKEILARLWTMWTMICKMIMDDTRDAHHVAEYMQRIIDPSFPAVEPFYGWTEKDHGIIRFKVVATGWTGIEWEKFYDENGYSLSDDARKFLNSPDFKPTPEGTIVHVAVLKGLLFDDNHRTTANVRVKAHWCRFKKANHDLACLIRKKFTNEEIKVMGLTWIIGMSDTIDVSVVGPRLLGADGGDGGPCIRALYDGLGVGWNRGHGFASEETQVKHSN